MCVHTGFPSVSIFFSVFKLKYPSLAHCVCTHTFPSTHGDPVVQLPHLQLQSTRTVAPDFAPMLLSTINGSDIASSNEGLVSTSIVNKRLKKDCAFAVNCFRSRAPSHTLLSFFFIRCNNSYASMSSPTQRKRKKKKKAQQLSIQVANTRPTHVQHTSQHTHTQHTTYCVHPSIHTGIFPSTTRVP